MSALTFNPLVTSRVAARGAAVRTTASKAVRATSSKQSGGSFVVRASYDEATPPPAPKPDMMKSFMNTMSFGGWAPETINGRVAQIAFVAGLGAELSTGESFTSQFGAHVGAIVFASGLITLASFMPNLQATDEYAADPKSIKPAGPWTIDAERANGRGAMVGLVSMIILEKVIGGPITGMFGGGSDELLSNTFYDEKFASEMVAVTPAPVTAVADFNAAAPVFAAEVAPVEVVAAVAAPAEGAEAAVVAYEAAEAAEPLRVEGAVDAEVEAQAMELGRQVSEAEEAAADSAPVAEAVAT